MHDARVLASWGAFRGGPIARTRFHLVVGSIIAVMALAAGPSSASACNNPVLTLSATSAEPGDTISWSLGNADAGAEYSDVEVAGRSVSPGGTVTGSKPTGSFVLSDYGDQPRSLPIQTVVSHDHEGGPWTAPATIQYRPPSPPPTATPPPADQGAPPPVSDLPRQLADPNGNAAPGGPARGRPESGAPREPDPRGAAPFVAREPVETAARIAAPADAVGEPDASAPPQVYARGVAGRPRQRAQAQAPTTRAPTPERVAPAPRHSPREVPVSAPAEDDPPPLLLVILSAAGLCVIGLFVLLRRDGQAEGQPAVMPDASSPPDARIEAELQEILAEERLKRFEVEHGRAFGEPGEPIRAGPADPAE